MMATAIPQVSPNPNTIPGGGDVYDPAWYEAAAAAMNRTTALVTQQAAAIATLEAQSTGNLTPVGVNPVEAASSVGTGPQFAYDDHAHAGVSGIVVPGPSTITGAVTLQGAVTSSGSTVTVGGYGAVKRVTAPYTVLTTDGPVSITAGSGSAIVTLPAANSLPSGWPVIVRNSTSGTTYDVQAAGSDTIDARSSYSYQLNHIGSSSYTGAFFITDGISDWLSFGTN